MENNESKKNKGTEDNTDASVKPDAETLNTTDPQEHMEGPISSFMHKVEKSFESEETVEEAEKEEKNK